VKKISSHLCPFEYQGKLERQKKPERLIGSKGSIHFSARKTLECGFFLGKPGKEKSTEEEMRKGIRGREE
jgi:hypothetical protein